jgi:hypothetical protein
MTTNLLRKSEFMDTEFTPRRALGLAGVWALGTVATGAPGSGRAERHVVGTASKRGTEEARRRGDGRLRAARRLRGERFGQRLVPDQTRQRRDVRRRLDRHRRRLAVGVGDEGVYVTTDEMHMDEFEELATAVHSVRRETRE